MDGKAYLKAALLGDNFGFGDTLGERLEVWRLRDVAEGGLRRQRENLLRDKGVLIEFIVAEKAAHKR